MVTVTVLTATQAHTFRMQDSPVIYVKDGGVVQVIGKDVSGEALEIYSRDTTIVRRAAK